MEDQGTPTLPILAFTIVALDGEKSNGLRSTRQSPAFALLISARSLAPLES